jgi:hypothetical protein
MTSRPPHFLGNPLTDGGEVVSLGAGRFIQISVEISLIVTEMFRNVYESLLESSVMVCKFGHDRFISNLSSLPVILQFLL